MARLGLHDAQDEEERGCFAAGGRVPVRAVPEVGDGAGGRFAPVQPRGDVVGGFVEEFGDGGLGEGAAGGEVEGCGGGWDGEGDFGGIGGSWRGAGVEEGEGRLGFGVGVGDGERVGECEGETEGEE